MTRRIVAGLIATTALALTQATAADAVPTGPVSLTGFQLRLDGALMNETLGESVHSAGDVNGDGFDDVIVGSTLGGSGQNGAAYVIYGKPGGSRTIDSAAILDSSDGFRIEGFNDDAKGGRAVAGGEDVNGDGLDDVIVGAPFTDILSLDDAGAAYVVYGKSSDRGTVDVSSFEGSGGANVTDGFRVAGLNGNQYVGWSVALVPDVDGDGANDIVIGSPYAGSGFRGAAYVIYGRSGVRGSVDLTDNGIPFLEGLQINGTGDFTGWSVAGPGDVNADGTNDILIGALNADANGRSDSGSAYVIYGKPAGRQTLELADTNGAGTAGTGVDPGDGYRIDGATGFSPPTNASRLGQSVADVGFFNDDNVRDLIIGSYESTNGRFASGAAYVVYGTAGTRNTIDLADTNGSANPGEGVDPDDGLRIEGAVEGGAVANLSVGGAGDVNADGSDDAIVGTPGRNNNTGAAYVIYGGRAGGSVDLADTNGTAAAGDGVDPSDGFRIDGAAEGDQAGWSVDGAGDTDGEGDADLVVGAVTTDNNGRTASGSAYLLDFDPLPAPVPTSPGAGATAPPAAVPPAAALAPRDTIAPALSQAKLSATRFAVDSRARASARKARRGTRLSFRLSEPATVVVVTQQRVGRRWRTIRTFGTRLPAGNATIAYSGRIKPRGRSRSLRPGRYRLRIRASDPAGNRGALTTLNFTIVR